MIHSFYHFFWLPWQLCSTYPKCHFMIKRLPDTFALFQCLFCLCEVFQWVGNLKNNVVLRGEMKERTFFQLTWSAQEQQMRRSKCFVQSLHLYHYLCQIWSDLCITQDLQLWQISFSSLCLAMRWNPSCEKNVKEEEGSSIWQKFKD